MITETAYQNAARELKCEVEIIKAVAGVESSGSGFLSSGQLKVLFEPHIFWRELKLVGIDPAKQAILNGDIVYEWQGAKPYGLYSQQWGRLLRAAKIHIFAAYKSASYGKFQNLGKYHEQAGYKTVTGMVQTFKLGEEFHLAAFVKMIIYRGLDVSLRNKDFQAIAKGWNGAGYASQAGRLNDYDYKIEQFYKKLKALK